jgi:hypothetical protein
MDKDRLHIVPAISAKSSVSAAPSMLFKVWEPSCRFGTVPTVYYIIYQSKEHEILGEKFKS